MFIHVREVYYKSRDGGVKKKKLTYETYEKKTPRSGLIAREGVVPRRTKVNKIVVDASTLRLEVRDELITLTRNKLMKAGTSD